MSNDKKTTEMGDSALVALRSRVALINGHFDLPADVKKAMDNIRLAISEAAVAVHKTCTASGIKFDAGRLIHAIDLMQQAKDTACVALILPFANKAADAPPKEDHAVESARRIQGVA